MYSVHALCRALCERDHELHVFTTNVDGIGVSEVPTAEPVNMDGVTVSYFPVGLGRRLFRSPAMGRALQATMRGFDVVHLHSVFLWPTMAAARAARRSGVPYVLAPRGMLVDDLINRKSRSAKRAWIRLVERDNVANAAAVHATSELEASELRKTGLQHRRIAVVANGIDVPAVDHGPTQEWPGVGDELRRPFVLFLGRVSWKKGLDRLIMAMRQVRDIDLMIAGNDDERYQPILERLAAVEGIAERVHFLGAVHGDRKWALLRSATIFALPSLSENFGIAAAEAMAVGCPVIVTEQVGLAEIIAKDGGGLVVDGAPSAIACAIAALRSNPRLRLAMGEAGRRIAAQRFSWPTIAEQMEGLYRECVEGHGHNDGFGRRGST